MGPSRERREVQLDERPRSAYSMQASVRWSMDVSAQVSNDVIAPYELEQSIPLPLSSDSIGK
jgi:hypothetical protein